MAILVEEGGQSRGPVNIFTIVILVVLLGVAAYYLFFAPAPPVEVVLPAKLESLSRISGVSLDTSSIFNSPVYQSLRQYVPNPEAGELGRPNPFSPF